jgi:hypothetical protein
MMRLLRRLSGGVTGTAALSLLFFVLYYLYLWLVVDLRLIYNGGETILNFPVFYRGWEFFRESVSWPGGFIEYVSAFLAQFFYVGWAGAVVATVQAWVLWLCTGSIISAVSGRRIRWVCFIPPILLLIIYGRYSYPFTTTTAMLASLVFVCLYLRIPLKSKPPALLVFLVLSIILYAIAGWAYLLFAMLCFIHELLVRRRWLMGVMYLVTAPVVSYIEGLLVFDMSVMYALRHFQSFSYEAGTVGVTVLCILYLFLPFTVVGLWLLGFFGIGPDPLSGPHAASGTPSASAEKSEKVEGNSPGKFAVWSAAAVAKGIGLVLPFVMGVVAVSLSHNDRLKTILEVDYYACRGMWPEVLQVARQHSTYGIANFAVNRALYNTGRLAEDMFAYPQHPGALFLAIKTNEAAYWGLIDTFFYLGQMNLAKYALTMCIETYGEQPILLKRLALVNMVKGNTGAARVCLGALSKTLFDSDWAREYLAKIERDPNLSTDEDVRRLRSLVPTTDRGFKSANENVFLDLLDSNRHNRMAFEYLMGFYLLTGQLDKFVGNLDRLDDFDYGGIPRVYEEAILLYNALEKKDVLPGREISVESRERFNNFFKVYIGQYGANKSLALKELARDYGDSYLFYSIYGRSGMKK